MFSALVAALIALAPTPQPDPGLPTIPPNRAPVQIIMDDGSRLDCTPNYAQCWSSQ